MEQRFFKDGRNGIMFGVCTGLSDYFGGDVTLWRVILVLLTIFTPLPIFLIYIIISLVAPDKNDF
jgi:phage shock protein PspC (stress-responsive transcriptional regulator)